jgi:hypothetical protein
MRLTINLWHFRLNSILSRRGVDLIPHYLPIHDLLIEELASFRSSFPHPCLLLPRLAKLLIDKAQLILQLPSQLLPHCIPYSQMHL